MFMKKEEDNNQVSKEALFFRAIVFVAVIIGIVQFFNILYSSVHDVNYSTKEFTNNSNNNQPSHSDSSKNQSKFIHPDVNLVKPDAIYENKSLKDEELLKPDTAK